MSEGRDWEAGTWEGARRAQLRRGLRLTVRERLQALESMTEVSERLSQIRENAHEYFDPEKAAIEDSDTEESAIEDSDPEEPINDHTSR